MIFDYRLCDGSIGGLHQFYCGLPQPADNARPVWVKPFAKEDHTSTLSRIYLCSLKGLMGSGG